jgi:hypothetical protein
MPTFNAATRLTITGRQLTILVEDTGYLSTIAGIEAQQAKLLSVDVANAAFYDQFAALVTAYETERQYLDGAVAAEYTEGTISPFTPGDLSSSAQTPGGPTATFFPSTPTAYTGTVPMPIPAVNGVVSAPGTNPNNELTAITQLLVERNVLLNGITGASSANTTTTASLGGGAQTAFVLAITSNTGFSINDYVYISDGTNAGIYQITALPTGSLTINSIFPSTATIASSATVYNDVVGFTNTERNTLVTGSYQEILTGLTTAISTYVTTWQSALNSQITALMGNMDTASPETTQNATALSNANAALAVVTAWLALSTTGANGRYVDTNLGASSTLFAQIGVRQAFIPTRITQIIASLGSVTVTGNTFTGTGPYFERYTWLNTRINVLSGSATRYFSLSLAISTLQALLASNLALLAQYNAYFTTKAITVNDSTTIIQVTDTVGLAQGDIVTVVSNTQPELTRAIMKIQGTTQLVLDTGIPNTYLLKDLMRVFKTL